MKAVVLFSGGQDSATCLAQALSECEEVHAVGFDFGQRHRVELEQASIISRKANVPFQIVDLAFLPKLSTNAQTDDSLSIEHNEGELPSTFVPGRNLFFLSVAAVIAREKGFDTLYTGVCETDYSGYPDCRSDFIASCEQTINLAMETKLKIKTPLMALSKAETVYLMKDLGHLEWYSETHTCYEGKRPACGVCPACLLRLKGFEEAGISDPLLYQ